MAQAAAGRLAENVMHFARVLRRAGLPVGTDRVALSLQALQVAGLASRNELHDVLGACLLDRAEHRDLFDQAFDLFWREPVAQGLAVLAPTRGLRGTPEQPDNRRLAEALFPRVTDPASALQPQDTEPTTAQSWNDREALRQADFESMSAQEWHEARRLLTKLHLLFEPLATRRTQAATRPGLADWRATMASMGRHGGDFHTLHWRQQRHRPAPLVVLADISGSMSRYSRMLLHFAHALGHAEARVESFVFGTRLTRTTRLLKSRDPDVAIGQVVAAVQDWSGGTRITQSVIEFNRRWARRVVPGNATVLLISDGLEHGDTRDLSLAMERLHKSCRRLIWLNPLLRFSRFEPKAAGIKAMLPHCDAFLPAHNLQSLQDLAAALSGPSPNRAPARKTRHGAAQGGPVRG